MVTSRLACALGSLDRARNPPLPARAGCNSGAAAPEASHSKRCTAESAPRALHQSLRGTTPKANARPNPTTPNRTKTRTGRQPSSQTKQANSQTKQANSQTEPSRQAGRQARTKQNTHMHTRTNKQNQTNEEHTEATSAERVGN